MRFKFIHVLSSKSNHIESYGNKSFQTSTQHIFHVFQQRKNPTPGPRWIYFRFSHLACQAPTPYAFWRPRVKPPSSRSGKHEDDCGKGCCFCEAYAMSYKKNVNIIYNVYVRKRYETVALFLYCREREATQLGERRGCSYQAFHVTPGSLRLILPERQGHWICHVKGAMFEQTSLKRWKYCI